MQSIMPSSKAITTRKDTAEFFFLQMDLFQQIYSCNASKQIRMEEPTWNQKILMDNKIHPFCEWQISF
jgi:hypothetical protein